MAGLIWTNPAVRDLEEIRDYIAIDDFQAAKKLFRKTVNRVELLRDFPEMCPHPHDLKTSRYRHLVVKPLRIFYRFENDTVFVYVMRSERLLKTSDIEDREKQ